VHGADRNRALADGKGYSFDGAATDVADGEMRWGRADSSGKGARGERPVSGPVRRKRIQLTLDAFSGT